MSSIDGKVFVELLQKGGVLLAAFGDGSAASGERGFLQSPWDWRALLLIKQGLGHLVEGSDTPVPQCLALFRSQRDAALSEARHQECNVDFVLEKLELIGFGQRGAVIEVQSAGCAIVATMTSSLVTFFGQYERFADACHGMAWNGMVEALLHAMEGHPLFASVQREACCTLHRILKFSAPAKRIAVVQLRRIYESVVAAMLAHPDVAELQYEACLVLHQISCADVSQFAGTQYDGIACIINAMREHGHHSKLQENAAFVLSILSGNLSRAGNAAYYSANRERIVNLGAIQLLATAMLGSNSKYIVVNACAALECLDPRPGSICAVDV